MHTFIKGCEIVWQFKMKSLIFCAVLIILQTCGAPPVKENANPEENDKNQEGIENYMEYHRYLTEVVAALESDPDFKQKLQNADENDIKSGKIANELEFVSHHVRTKLDEIKRIELERLKDLVEKKKKLTEKIESAKGKVMDDVDHNHVDSSNVYTFEIEDLKKLIAKVQQDLAEADKMRKEQFKEYEMQKEFEKQQKLNSSQPEERQKLEKEFKEKEEKHKNHEKLHEPGHKAQLEEVWHEQDKMTEEFDPKTFFLMHDMDSNGLWDQNEVKALFIKELDKMYQAGAPEDDIRERVEEMERMRETVFREVDTNNDGFIDYMEFLAQTKKEAFKDDHGWNGLDEQKPYTNEELEEYISRHQMQMQHQQPPPPGYYPNQPGYHPPPVQYHAPPVPQMQSNDINHQPGNAVPLHPNQVYQQAQYQQYNNPNQQYHQQQANQQYQQHNQPNYPNNQQYNVPQMQHHPNQPSMQNNQQYQQNVPQMQHQNQPPVQVNQQNVPQMQQHQVPLNQQNVPQMQQHQVPVNQQNVPQNPNQVNQQYQQNVPQTQQYQNQPVQQNNQPNSPQLQRNNNVNPSVPNNQQQQNVVQNQAGQQQLGNQGSSGPNNPK